MFTVETSGESYSARALILATGVKHRRLGLAEEASYLGRGLSYCAVCDGAFFKNRTVAVVGGGNAALQSAIYLSDVAEKVYLIHRRTQYRAEEAVIRAMEAKPNIEPVLNKTVAALSGEPLLAVAHTVRYADRGQVGASRERRIRFDRQSSCK